jgi:hypothetical protein
MIRSASFPVLISSSILFAGNPDLYFDNSSETWPRTDSLGNLKWAQWYYDSTNNRSLYLQGPGTINSIRETSRGNIICARMQRMVGPLPEELEKILNFKQRKKLSLLKII